MPASFARLSSVQRFPGSECIALKTAFIRLSANASSQPGPAVEPCTRCNLRASTSNVCATCSAINALPGAGSRNSRMSRSIDVRNVALSVSLVKWSTGREYQEIQATKHRYQGADLADDPAHVERKRCLRTRVVGLARNQVARVGRQP